jgi:hypothetical protein
MELAAAVLDLALRRGDADNKGSASACSQGYRALARVHRRQTACERTLVGVCLEAVVRTDD